MEKTKTYYLNIITLSYTVLTIQLETVWYMLLSIQFDVVMETILFR